MEQEYEDKIQVLKGLAEDINVEERKILGLNNRLSSLSSKKNWVEMQVYTEISNEKDADGKAVHSNDTKRKAATEKRLRANPEYEKLCDEEKENHQRLGETKIEVEYLKRMFSAAKAELALITAIKSEGSR